MNNNQSNGANSHGMDSLLMGRRQAVERELEATEGTLAHCNAVFDESGNFLVRI